MEYTHVVVTFKADDKEYLYRVSDGMRIGGRQYAVVVYGTEPNKSASHVFIDSESASQWLRGQYAVEDLKAQGIEAIPVVQERSGDPTGIVIPDGMGEEFMGGARKIHPVMRKSQ